MEAMTRTDRDLLRRERVWLSFCPGVAHPGVVLWRRLGFVRVYCWDENRGTTATLFRPSRSVLLPRTDG